MVLALDRQMQTLTRAWCVDEVHHALDKNMPIKPSFNTFPGIPQLRRYSCRVDECQARPQDRERILAKVRAGTGEEAFNAKVTSFVHEIAEGLVRKAKSN